MEFLFCSSFFSLFSANVDDGGRRRSNGCNWKWNRKSFYYSVAVPIRKGKRRTRRKKPKTIFESLKQKVKVEQSFVFLNSLETIKWIISVIVSHSIQNPCHIHKNAFDLLSFPPISTIVMAASLMWQWPGL